VRRRQPPARRATASPRITVVTPNWGNPDDERYFAARTLAGAVSTAADVTVLHLTSTAAGKGGTRRDGAFRLVRVAATAPRPVETAIVLAALSSGAGGRLPAVAGPHLQGLEGGHADDVAQHIAATEPDVVVIAGINQAWPANPIESLPRRPRVVTMPLIGDDPRIALPGYRDYIDAADVVFSTSRGERAALATLEPARGRDRRPELVDLRLPIPVNRASAKYRVAGLTNFHNYVVFLRGFPAGTAECSTVPDYVQLRRAVPGLGVADVAHERWRVHDDTFDFVIPVGPSRVNLWRLVSHAVALVDLRPGGVLGREAIESLLLGTPVLVPRTSTTRSVVEESGGGLVYGGEDELVDALELLTSASTTRDDLARRGTEWASRLHGDHARLTEVTKHLFGSSPAV
jgi:hypothetical protein